MSHTPFSVKAVVNLGILRIGEFLFTFFASLASAPFSTSAIKTKLLNNKINGSTKQTFSETRELIY